VPTDGHLRQLKGKRIMNEVAQKEDRLVRDSSPTERSYVSPDVNIFETKDDYVLEAEMPGVNKEGLEITLEGNVLTIIGHRNDGLAKADLRYRESKQADFRRVFELDPAIDPQRIAARIEQGILVLHLPKTEKVKPRKIKVSE
jgi:HSP20 family protein